MSCVVRGLGAALVTSLALVAGCARDGVPGGSVEDAAVPVDLVVPADLASAPRDLLPPCMVPDSEVPLFAPALTTPVSEATFDITTADLDRDGRLDVVVAGGEQVAASLLLNRGGGVLVPETTLADTGNSSVWHWVAVGDVDGDGWPELVVTNGWGFMPPPSILVYHNDHGVLANAVSLPTVFHYPSSGLVVADLNGDGVRDIAATMGGYAVEYLNRGNGSFEVPIRWSGGGRGATTALVMADLNGDGNPDFVIANYQDSQVDVAYSQRLHGIYDTAAAFDCGPNPWNLATGDLDGDGAVDVVVGNEDGLGGVGGITVLYNRGEGMLEAGIHYGAGNTLGMAVGDVDGDGRLDIVSGGGGTSVFLNRGGRRFELAERYPGASALTLADMNGDGKLDLVTAAGKSVSVWLNQGPGCR